MSWASGGGYVGIDDDTITLDSNSKIQAVGVVPIGGIVPFLKNMTSVPTMPDSFVECNGQTISNIKSPMNGETVPNINGDNRFLRGNATSSGTGGSATKDLSHTHGLPKHYVSSANDYGLWGGSSSSTSSAGSPTQNIEPQYINVVWIIRIY